MSAQPVLAPATRPTRDPGEERARRILRLVPPPRPRLARMPFLIVLVGLVGVGMVGLLLLNTGLQNQAFQASELRRQAAEMSYQEGELVQLVIEAGSTRELTRKATELGMRPSRGVAFVELPDGRVSGNPVDEDGLFLPSALSRSPEQLAQERAERAAKRAQERRTSEQRVLLDKRQRILDARAAARAAQQPPAGQPAQPEQPPTQADPAAQPVSPDQPPAGATAEQVTVDARAAADAGPQQPEVDSAPQPPAAQSEPLPPPVQPEAQSGAQPEPTEPTEPTGPTGPTEPVGSR